nr:hypothetical protein [Aeromonas salmonicida]
MDPEIANNGMGVAHLLSQNTGVGLLPFILLVLMSLGTSYYTLLKIVLREFNFEVRHSPMPPDGTLRIP